jgi:hypothetical protein
MKRIQTIVEEWHYQWLYKEAERQQISMASLLRQLLTEAIEHHQAAQTLSDPIFGIIGLGAGPVDGISSENLDDYLYRTDRESRPLLKVAEPSTPVWESAYEQPVYR